MQAKSKAKPISLSYLPEYIRDNHPEFAGTVSKSHVLKKFKPHTQGEFGKELNCSLTSMASSIDYLTKGQYGIEVIYPYIRKLAGKFLYTPDLIGTISFTIGPIYAIACRHFGLKGSSGAALIKNIGFSFNRIRKCIDGGTPVILNMFRDGRHYYGNHTVTVVGYRIYKKADKELRFLILDDNWSKERRFLDYKKMWAFASINYFLPENNGN